MSSPIHTLAVAEEFSYLPYVWDDLRAPANTMAAGATPADIITFAGTASPVALRIRGFDGGATLESMEAIFQLPHGYVAGTDLKPHVHWCATTAAAGDVKWNLTYQWLNNGDVGSGTSTTLSATVAASGVAWTQQLTSLGTMTGTGKKKSSVIVCTLWRDPGDAADTYGADAGLFELDIHYQMNTPGSYAEIPT